MFFASWFAKAEPTFSRGGIHPPEYKELTEECAIESFTPRMVTIPVSQSLGPMAKPVVARRDKVRKGDVIATTPDGDISVHSPVNGKVKNVLLGSHPILVNDTVIVIAVDKASDEQIPEFVADESWQQLTSVQMLERIRLAGVVGLGGATFPTYRKLSIPDGVNIDTLIINGSECEPYLTCDYRLMLEEAEKVVLGAWAIAKIIGVKRCLIGVEDNKSAAVEQMRSVIESLGIASLDHPVEMSVSVTETKYPQGSEKQLVQALTGRTIAKGQLPMHVGMVVQNVATAYACLDAIRHKRPVIDRVLTVSGKGISRPANLRVPIGTPINDIIEHCGGLQGDVVKVLSGGPMMGRAIGDLSVPVTKGTSGLLFLTEGETNLDGYLACIGCGECLDACPLGLQPNKVSQYVDAGRPLETEIFGVMECFECGCCSYSCPSNRPLVQFMQVGKAAYRNEARNHA